MLTGKRGAVRGNGERWGGRAAGGGSWGKFSRGLFGGKWVNQGTERGMGNTVMGLVGD